jgi:endonuclease/exonuclease/phosphatase family metal-dependent hydrolase
VVALDADVALLQEAPEPPKNNAAGTKTDAQPWRTEGGNVKRNWRAAVVKLSSRVQATWHEPKSIEDAAYREFAVSRFGTLSAATITAPGEEPLIFISMYAAWEGSHATTKSRWNYADASAHRLISDLSVFIGQQRRHRIIAAGDLNILHGYGEHGSPYWGARYQTVFDRFSAIGLRFVGPQSPYGRQAKPWPKELPEDSMNVPTFHTAGQGIAGAARQLDFVFASRDIADQVRVRALNDVSEWGKSDHCRVAIEIG